MPRTPYAVRLANPGKHLYPPPLSPLSAERFAELLADRPLASRRAQLYLHLPFCETLCTFCPIHKVKLTASSPVAGYVADLIRELEALARLPLIAALRFDSVYFGGGTPSATPDREIAALVETIRRRFQLDERVQLTFEGHVRSLTREKVRFARSLGFNRLSTGLQTFDPELRRRLNLTPSHDEVRRCVEAAREEGFPDFNLDLMVNLPGQTPAVWERDLLAAVALAPSGIDVYDTVLAHTTPLHRQVERGELLLETDPRRQAANYHLAEDVLAAHGYRQRNLYAWDRAGFDNRLLGCQAELRDRALHVVGAGMTAFSLIDGTPFINEANLHAWRERVRASGHGVKWHHLLTPREEMERFMVLSLEEFVFDHGRFAAAFGRDMEEEFARQLDSFRRRGLIEPAPEGWRLTRTGRAWATTMSVAFFGAPALVEILRARIDRRYFGGMTREEELELPVFALFHPEELPAAWSELPLVVAYLRFLRASEPRWLPRLLLLAARTAARWGLPALRWYAGLAGRALLARARGTLRSRRPASVTG